MHYTILFTDETGRHTQAIVVVTVDENNEHCLQVDRHAHVGNNYAKAYLLDPTSGFLNEPIYVRSHGEENREVECALALLAEDILSGAM